MFLHLCLFLFTGHRTFFPTSPISADLLLCAWSEAHQHLKVQKAIQRLEDSHKTTVTEKQDTETFFGMVLHYFALIQRCCDSLSGFDVGVDSKSVCDLLCLLTNVLHHFLLLCMYFANVLHLLGVIFLLPVSILCIFLVIFHQFPLLRSFLCLFDYFVSLFYYLVAAFSSFCTNFRLFLLLVLHISLLSNIALISNNFTCFQSFYTHQCSNCLNVAHFCDTQRLSLQ